MRPRVVVFLVVSVGTAVGFLGCDSSSTSGPANGADGGALGVDGAAASPDGGDPETPDGSTPTGDCPNGIARLSTTELAALSQLRGTWTIVPEDDLAGVQRTLVFGDGQTGDLGCTYNQGIHLDYLQHASPGASTCTSDRYLLRVVNNGKDTNGRWRGERKVLFKDGGPDDFLPEISATWTFEAGRLYFDNEHFSAGGAFLCP